VTVYFLSGVELLPLAQPVSHGSGMNKIARAGDRQDNGGGYKNEAGHPRDQFRKFVHTRAPVLWEAIRAGTASGVRAAHANVITTCLRLIVFYVMQYGIAAQP
jgi:hypothetical protein